jgi:hypothetical protein
VEHELPKVLDGIDEPVTVEDLEAVVRRAGQRRRATLVAGAAALLLCGAVVGALARGPGGERTTGFASPPVHPQPPTPAPMAKMHDGGPTGLPLTHLFRRETSGVAIRVYRASWGEKAGAVDAKCGPPDFIQGELSNAAAVGFAMAPLLPGDQFALLGAGMFGQGEGEPVTWAAVRAGAGVSTVRFRLGEAADLMEPHEGITLLAAPGKTGDGVVEGLDGDGKVVATQALSQLSPPPMDPACVPPECVVDSGSGSVGSAGAATSGANVAPGQGPAVAVPAEPANPPPGQAGDPAPDPGMPLMKVEKGFVCGTVPAAPALPPPGVPVPDRPFSAPSAPASVPPATASPTSTVAPTTTAGSPTSTTSPNQAP